MSTRAQSQCLFAHVHEENRKAVQEIGVAPEMVHAMKNSGVIARDRRLENSIRFSSNASRFSVGALL